jgi:putative transcriptional regulator
LVELLNNRIREFRETKGWTQLQLANVTGLSRKTINTVENGVFVPSVIVALKLAAALEVSVEILFSLSTEALDI